jgi:adenylate kinase
MRHHLIFLGAPGSGKGTQASKLANKEKYKHLSTGDLLRTEVAKKSTLGLTVQKIIDDGKLVSDDLVVEVIKNNINLADNTYIFDGFPRNIAQAKILDQNLFSGVSSKAIYFEIPLSVLVDRLSNRRTCGGCGEIYNLITKKPQIDGKCDKCGSTELVQRKDDKPDVIAKRLEVFKEIEPVLEYYKAAGRLEVIDAQKSEQEIFNALISLIN